MQKKTLKLLFFSMVLTAGTISAQNESLIQKKILDKKGNLSTVSFKDSSNLSVNQAQAAIKENLQLANSSFQNIKLESDKLGFTHTKQQQYYKGIKVEFGEYTFHSKDQGVKSGSGKIFQIEKDNLTSKISEEDGLKLAISHVNAETYLWETENVINYKKPEGELLILPTTEGISTKTRLVYKYDIYANTPLYRADVYVDAQTGEIVFENNKIHHADTAATGESLYNNTVSFVADVSGRTYYLESSQFETYDMNESTNYNRAQDVTSSSSYFSNAATAVQAHYGAEQTYDYFTEKHGRDSFDNNGSVIKSYVSYDSDYVNAFWDGSRMTYGDGDGTNYGPLVSLDIVGHEIGHGVTEYSANLVYSYESGALNESFSDIFGESIEFYAQGNNDWLMGDQIGYGGSGGALRSISNPNIFNQPDTYYGTNWYTGSGDSGGVHYNSGVQNFWFYLLSVGGSGTNDNGDAFNVTQIGMDAAAAVAYRNLTVYLSSSSQYEDAREGGIQAAIDLYGADSIEVIAVTNAWYAVGVGDAYNSDDTDDNTDDNDDDEPGDGSELDYCNSKGSDSSYEWIDYVAFGGFTNTTSNDGGYGDYTNKIASVASGSTNTITISAGFATTSYTEYWSIWIDLDQNGTFENDEQMVSGSSSSSSNLTASITIPSSASLGTTRMRVSMKYNSDQSACETFSYGEVEDYTVNITNTLISDETYVVDYSNTTALGYEEAFTLSTYPNPVNEYVQVNIKNPSPSSSYRIMSLRGLLVQEGLLTDNVIDTSRLSYGIYIFEVSDGQKINRSKLVKN